MKRLVFIIITLFILASNFQVAAIPIEPIIISHKSNLLPHNPIYINGNDDFTEENGVIAGDGTAENPYVVAGWNIHIALKDLLQGNYGILIENTDAFFEIKNCNIRGIRLLETIGIRFNNVTNGKIINCNCCKNSFGILLVSSSNNTVENCKCCHSKVGASINGCQKGYTSFSNNNTIKNCLFTLCEDGIYFCCLPSSSNNIIKLCTFDNNKRGICLDHCIHHTTIVGCNISNNKEVGITIISASSNNHISHNVFWENNEHAVDNCLNSWDNGPFFGGNYWSDHNGSEPYIIPGFGNNKDHYPLNETPDTNSLIALFMYNPKFLFIDQQICFDATISYDSSNNISSYEWDFGDGNISSGCKATHTYITEGEYNVTLKITNDTTSDTWSQTLAVIQLHDGTIYVSNGSSIQQAITNAKPGYTIYVDSGIYTENIIVNKPCLNIIGCGSRTTILDGRQRENVINISSNMINITGFTITNSSDSGAGIQLGVPDYNIDSIQCCICNNTISGNYIGIKISDSEQNVIFNNIIHNNVFGIYLVRSFENIFIQNRLLFIDKGIWLEYGSNWNKVNNNEIMNNFNGIVLNSSWFNEINRNILRKNMLNAFFINCNNEWNNNLWNRPRLLPKPIVGVKIKRIPVPVIEFDKYPL